MSKDSIAIGIDLGTTFSCVSYVDPNGGTTIISSHSGSYTIPSVVHVGEKIISVGEEAVSKRGSDPAKTIFQVKRLMGKRTDDEGIVLKNTPFEIISDDNGKAVVRVSSGKESEKLYPQQISAMILAHLKGLAEHCLQRTVTDAVITIPANFTDAQRQATLEAGKIAGLNVLRLLHEPSAAALAYGRQNNDGKKRKILVYDLGGGTFDVSIVEMEGINATVLASRGIQNLGGEDFTNRLYDDIVARCSDLNLEIANMDWDILQSCEKAKLVLSRMKTAAVDLSYNGKSVRIDVTRSGFSEQCEDLFESTLTCIEEVLQEANVEKKTLDDVVLVGGSSRIPMVQEMIREYFDHRQLRFDSHPDLTVAEGAALLAHSLANKEEKLVSLMEITSISIGHGIKNDVYVIDIPAGSKLPFQSTLWLKTSFDYQTCVTLPFYVGECPIARENERLCTMRVKCLPKPHGESKIDVELSLDENRILSATAKSIDTGIEVYCSSRAKEALSAEKVEELKLNAMRRMEEDKTERSRLETLNELENAVYSLRRRARQMNDENLKQTLMKMTDEELNWIGKHKNDSTRTFKNRLVAFDIRKNDILSKK